MTLKEETRIVFDLARGLLEHGGITCFIILPIEGYPIPDRAITLDKYIFLPIPFNSYSERVAKFTATSHTLRVIQPRVAWLAMNLHYKTLPAGSEIPDTIHNDPEATSAVSVMAMPREGEEVILLAEYTEGRHGWEYGEVTDRDNSRMFISSFPSWR